MKKPNHQPRPPRKLVLRREAIASMTPPQLERVAGGDGQPCSGLFPESCDSRSFPQVD